MLLGKDLHQKRFLHPGQATTWHSGVCQVATGKQHLAVPCCPPAMGSSWLDHPCHSDTRAPPKLGVLACPVCFGHTWAKTTLPSCHQGTTQIGCAGLPSLFWPHLGKDNPCQAVTRAPPQKWAGLPSLFFATGCLSPPLRVPLHSLD